MDPNLVIWDANSMVLTDWESVAVTQRHTNPNHHSTGDSQAPETIITVSTKLDILDDGRFIAMNSNNHPVCRALDEFGREVQLANRPSPFMSTHDYRPFRVGSTSIDLEVLLDPNQSLPDHLPELDFLVYTLTGQPLLVWDIPFETTEHTLDVTPDVRMTVNAEGSIESDLCSLNVTLTPPVAGNGTADSETSETSRKVHSIFSDFSEYDIVYHVKAIDSSGHISGNTLTGLVFHKRQTNGSWTFSSSQGVSNCREIQSLRVTIAVNPRWVAIPLHLDDIPIAR